jgi:hypothetical protein
MPKNCIFVPDLETYKKLEPSLRDRLGSWRWIYTDERFPREVCSVSDATIVKLVRAGIPIDFWDGPTIEPAERWERVRRTWGLTRFRHVIEMAAFNDKIVIDDRSAVDWPDGTDIRSEAQVWGVMFSAPTFVRFVMETVPDIQEWTKVPFDFSIDTYAKELLQWSVTLTARTYWTFDHCRFELPIDMLPSDQIEPRLLLTKIERSGRVEEFLVAKGVLCRIVAESRGRKCVLRRIAACSAASLQRYSLKRALSRRCRTVALDRRLRNG